MENKLEERVEGQRLVQRIFTVIQGRDAIILD
jgi:hypothetical protein